VNDSAESPSTAHRGADRRKGSRTYGARPVTTSTSRAAGRLLARAGGRSRLPTSSHSSPRSAASRANEKGALTCPLRWSEPVSWCALGRIRTSAHGSGGRVLLI